MKNIKKLIPAFAMLLVAAVLLGSSTFAWFSMNTQVSATGMQVKATAEDGIVIASYSDASTAPVAADFADTDATYIGTVTELRPVFTADTEDWYHAASKKSNDGQDYTAAGYASVDNVAAVLYADVTEYNTAKGTSLDSSDFDALTDEQKIKTPAVNYYQLNKFQIKSTGTAQAVYVKEISVTTPTQDYSPSLRVAIKTGDYTLIYAPLRDAGSSSTYTFTEIALASTAASDAIGSDVTATINYDTRYNKLASIILDDVGATPEDVFIYLFFDGEDAACKSDNIENPFEGLTVAVTFTSETPAN